MSSSYSCSPDDDFFQSLNESLTNEYASQMISNFMSNLTVSISNLDDDPEEGFIFYDDENHYSNGNEVNNISVDMFDDDDEPHLKSLQENEGSITPEKDVNNESVDMFDDEPHENHVHEKQVPLISEKEWDTESVDMFDDEPQNHVQKKEVALILEKESDTESVDMFADEPHQNHLHEKALILEKDSDTESVEMFLEYEIDMEVMDVDSDCSEEKNISEQPNVLDFPNHKEALAEDSDHVYITEQRDIAEFLNDRHEMEQVDQSNKTANVEFAHNIDMPLVFSKDENHLRLNDIPSNQKSLSPEVESEEVATVENSRNEQLSQYSDILVSVSSTISYCDENEISLSVPLEAPQKVHQTIQTTRSEISNFHDISFTNEKTYQDSECNSVGSRGFLLPFNLIANTSLDSSDFGGFLPVDLGGHMANMTMSRTPTDRSSRFCTDLDTSLCKEYEIANDFLPELRSFSPAASLRPRSLSRSTNFRGFSPVPSLSPRLMLQHSTRSLSRNESDLDTTLCEEYETMNSLMAEMLATQTGNFNLEEAYSQCFLDSQNQAR